jgi:hypothetical protein
LRSIEQLIGLLSSVLAIAFLLTCLYYLVFRRRYVKDMSDVLSPLPMDDKVVGSTTSATSASQSASTMLDHESGKETKMNGYIEQTPEPLPNGDFAIVMPTIGNGHVSPNMTNGLLVNGSTDPSELRLLQHEDN